jgi:TetR/AcrR family transcriptional regulator, regulator of cefoperazone and chloramphenicol sensitivity
MPPNDLQSAVPPARATAHSRGEDTRLRILRTALELFATDGYEGASTRTLAQRAGVNLPAIQYYFGSKEGLYHAVIDHIAERMEARVAPVTAEIREALASGATSRERVLSLLCRMLEEFVALVTDRAEPDWESRSLFFARAEIEVAEALHPLHQRVMRRIVEPCAALVGKLIGRPAEAEETLLKTIALIGQVTVFCNRKAQHVLGWQAPEPRQVKALQALISEHTRAIFANAPAKES